ncbi:MAG: glycoside hydrolase family 127 protein [Thermoflavifilum sp.]|nr:glycoside hydrolase family 127 protein [Thermoflavifilum sp.]
MKKWFLAISCLLAALGLQLAVDRPPVEVSVVERPPLHMRNHFYPSNRSPLEPQSFIFLPIGSIVPQGWIRKMLQLQRDGLNGRLSEISAWLVKKNNAWLSRDGKGDHGWEEVPYWLRGYSALAYELHDTAMIREAKFWLEAVIQSQRPDGYFGPEANLHASNGKPDLWPNMVMLDCLQSYYSFSHDPRVLDLMQRYFQWELALPDSVFLTHYWEKSRAGDNLYSVLWLYNLTADSSLLHLAEKIHRHTANWEQPGTLPNWHNVNIAQCFREPATYFLVSHDSSDLHFTYADFQLIRRLYGQVPGGMFGADEDARPGRIGPEQAVETCGMVEQMYSDEQLLAMTGDPFWADHAENVAFNSYPAALMPNMRALRYLTAPNMINSDWHNHAPGVENEGPFFQMNPFSHRCCQHNHGMGWPYYAASLWMATPDDGLAALLYNACSVDARVGEGDTVQIVEDTHYPFSDRVQFVVHLRRSQRFPLYLRIPAWCHSPQIELNGQPIVLKSAASGKYVRLERRWEEGDRLSLSLPMELWVQHWTYKGKDTTSGVSLNYGPLSFSLQIKEQIKPENPTLHVVPDARWRSDADTQHWRAYNIEPVSPWNVALLANAQGEIHTLRLVKSRWPSDNNPFTAASCPIRLWVLGQQVPTWEADANGLCGPLPPSPLRLNTPIDTLELIPMGAARLRITVFPLAINRH